MIPDSIHILIPETGPGTQTEPAPILRSPVPAPVPEPAPELSAPTLIPETGAETETFPTSVPENDSAFFLESPMLAPVLLSTSTEISCRNCGVTEFVTPMDDEGEFSEDFLENYLCDDCERVD